MLEEATLWRLIEAGAEATPRAPMAVDEQDRALSFAGYRDTCVALVGALARLDTVQNPILPSDRAPARVSS